MTIPGRRSQHTPVNPHLTPILNNPNHYCRTCDEKFPSQLYYRMHAKKVRKMKVTKSFGIQNMILTRCPISTTQTLTAAYVIDVLHPEEVTSSISSYFTI